MLVAKPFLSQYFFISIDGSRYINPKSGEFHGWKSIWQRVIQCVLKETKVTEQVTGYDIRAKAGFDAESLECVQQLLTHSSVFTTKRIYRH